MSEIVLSDGITTVTVYECPEERPTERITYDVRRDTDDATRVYQNAAGVLFLHMAGRLLSKADAERLEAWSRSMTLLAYIGRDDISDGGWRIHGDTPPQIKRKDGDSPDWLVDMKLWRVA